MEQPLGNCYEQQHKNEFKNKNKIELEL